MSYIYVYCDNLGAIQETINDTPLRLGDVSIDHVALYWDKSDTETRTVSSVSYGATLPDGTSVTGRITSGFSSTLKVPYDSNRILTKFAYKTDYLMYIVPITTAMLQKSGLLSISVILNFSDGTSLALGILNVVVGENAIQPDNTVTQGNYLYLLNRIGSSENYGNSLSWTANILSLINLGGTTLSSVTLPFADYLPLAGGTMTGSLNVTSPAFITVNNPAKGETVIQSDSIEIYDDEEAHSTLYKYGKITNNGIDLTLPTTAGTLTTQEWVSASYLTIATATATYMPLSGGTFTGAVNFGTYASTWSSGTDISTMTAGGLAFSQGAHLTQYERTEIYIDGNLLLFPTLSNDETIATLSYVDSAVAVETARAETAEQTNATAIATEISRATTTENALQTDFNALQSNFDVISQEFATQTEAYNQMVATVSQYDNLLNMLLANSSAGWTVTISTDTTALPVGTKVWASAGSGLFYKTETEAVNKYAYNGNPYLVAGSGSSQVQSSATGSTLACQLYIKSLSVTSGTTNDTIQGDQVSENTTTGIVSVTYFDNSYKVENGYCSINY